MDSLLSVNHLYFSRDNTTIFKDINLRVARGKITAIMGPSGCGKTTLLRLIGGQLKPDKGAIELDNQVVHQLSRTDLYRLRRKIGVLFQSGALFSNLTVYENVAFPLQVHTDLPEMMIHDIVMMKLQLVGLRGAFQLLPGQLSGGMARRVALARAIALDPELIMYDEPFTGLDPIALGVTVKLICDLKQTLAMTAVLISHDVQQVMDIADYVYLLGNKKIIGEGTPAALRADCRLEVRQFLQGLPDGVVPFHYPSVSYQEDLFY